MTENDFTKNVNEICQNLKKNSVEEGLPLSDLPPLLDEDGSIISDDHFLFFQGIMNKKNFDTYKICNTRGIVYYILGTVEWILNPKMYPCENPEKVIEDCCWNSDDNQFTFGNYNWKEKVHLKDAEMIIDKIQKDVLMRESELNSRIEKGGIEEDKK